MKDNLYTAIINYCKDNDIKDIVIKYDSKSCKPMITSINKI